MAKVTVTSLDVARLAGVSQSAVSRVFTPGASVSAKMATKVRDAATQLGYRPNILARGLITGKSRIIGLAVAYLHNQFYPEAVDKLSVALQQRGYHLLVFTANTTNADELSRMVDELLDYQVEGVIAASVALSSDLADRCAAAGVPLVLFNRHMDDDRLSSITSDNREGGRKLAEFLIKGGHERIAYIAGWEGASTQRDREAGFRAGLAQGSCHLFARGDGKYIYEAAAEEARQMFRGADRPDAVFVANDHMAFAVMDVLRFELGLRIPEDVSVVGYDDVQPAAWPAYNLTTVRQPANRMVDATMETLFGRIDTGDKAPKKVVIDGPLMIRKSARIPEGYKT